MFQAHFEQASHEESYNQVIHLYVNSESNQFFPNHKLLQSFKGKIVLYGEINMLSTDFYETLIEEIEIFS